MALFSIVKTVLTSVVKKPATLEFPAKPRPVFERTRGHIENNIGACIFCGMCQRKCPTGAIETARKDGVWSIERLNCIQCGGCVEVCPTKCLSMANEQSSPAYAASSKTILTGEPPQPKKPAASKPPAAQEAV